MNVVMDLKRELETVERPRVADAKMWRMSRAELERRWSLVRDRLAERQIDALVVQGYEDKAGGYVKWLTDTPAGYPRTIIFHRDEPMTVVDHGPNGQHARHEIEHPDQPGVGEVITTWAFQAAHYSNHLNADRTLEVLRGRGYRRVAIANPSALPYGFVAALQAGLAGSAELIDETDFLDRAKAIKSAEEIALIRRGAAMQDEVFAEVVRHARPGMRDFELNAFAKHQLELRGTERGVYIGRSAPMGRPTAFGYRHFQGRTMGAGDYIVVLLESNSLGGLWTEMARTITFGKAAPELVDAFLQARAAQDDTVRRLVPGASAAEVFDAFNAHKVAGGGAPERRIHCHGQGYDSVERPLVRSDETMILEAGFNLAVHPSHATAHAWGHVCDNWLIEEGGGGYLHATPREIVEL